MSGSIKVSWKRLKQEFMISEPQKVPVVGREHRLVPWNDPRISLLFILAAAVLVLMGNLGVSPLWGSEGRWALICRHMYRSGDVFHPLLGSVLYWDKPLLSYWLVLPFAYINGGVTEAVVRLPSVLSAFLLLLLTFDLARMWFGTRTGLLSTAILMTSYGFVFWARNAQVEMLNAFVILLAIWYFLKHKSDRGHGWLYVFGVIMGLGANLKGLPGYGVPIFSITLLLIVQKECPPALAWRHCVAATALSLAVYFALPLATTYFTGTWAPLELVWKENIVRFFNPFDHKGPIWTYFIRIFDLTAPWSLFLPPALVNLFPKLRERTSPAAAVITLFAAVFVFFTLSGSRRPYYLLPIVPFVSILVAHLLVEFSRCMVARPLDRFIKVFGFLLGIILIAPFIVFVAFPDVLPLSIGKPWFGVMLAALIPAGVIACTCSISRRIEGMVGAMLIVSFIYVLGVIPFSLHQKNLRTEVAKITSLGKPFAFLQKTNDRVLFYLDQPCQVFSSEAAAYDWAVKRDGLLIVEDNFLDKKRWRPVLKSRTWRAIVPLLSQHAQKFSARSADSMDDKQTDLDGDPCA
jgi:4-amino-4-deoxy-L-arabinose transferase-like glycosyltransferase